MPKHLRDNISSYYIQAANRLNSRKARQKIVAYVESYDDIFFWRTVLSGFENERIFFEVMLPSKQSLTRGKKSVLMNLIAGNAGQNMIACVDADYDYLLQNTTPTSREVNNNPFVFHTYGYSIENFQCYAPSLHNVAVAVTLNDHSVFDFQAYLEAYSRAIFPLFVWNIWFYRRNIYAQFTLTSFNHIIETGHFTIERSEEIINKVRRKVHRKIQQLQIEHPDAKQSYLELKDELVGLGLTPSATYLFIQGHHLFDTVVLPALRKVCDLLIRERETEINISASHNIQRHNELSCYERRIDDLLSALRRNTAYTSCDLFQRLTDDIRIFLDRNYAASVDMH